MSLDATNWAWKLQLNEKPGGSRKPLKRLLLLSLADRAGEDHCCYPSMARLEKDTGLERKTVLKIIAELLEEGLIEDTGERKGITKRVKVYRLLGIHGREMTPNPTASVQVNHANHGMTNHPNNGTLNSAVNGTQNLPKNLLEESKYKNSWLDLEKLEVEVFLANAQIAFQALITASWFERERRAFEIYNQDRLSSANLMYHFADWLIRAYQYKYKQSCKPRQKALSSKQIELCAKRLANHHEFCQRYAAIGESYTAFTARIATQLQDVQQQLKWSDYLKQINVMTDDLTQL